MRDYAATDDCRMEFLRRQLDDPAYDQGAVAPCGRCDRCTGRPVPAEVSDAALQAAQGALGRPGVEVEPRRMWPTGMKAAGVELSGRIPVEAQAEVGRALGRLSDVGWGGRLREVFGGPDAPVTDDVLRAVIAVLAGWGWRRVRRVSWRSRRAAGPSLSAPWRPGSPRSAACR
jgi:ATP-dependent DNA helicase RecQ